ncbi:Putative peptidoglycan binding domain protein [Synechococcus sp. PCC 7335]|uniref:peptidoglycan-binding domain-containing protein n=1 Tax=Synechococcus sp. (strain ATCC 29403 / PCC 7335) TaxID=91464 RepID=UPI00017EDFD7|nr:peptidoglycan-binding domain-containing protein [Synechococcus sp. PCC 7335]EDX83997.1 Putative peptidoglycan binding domain protein [Synechococcus sp. PCC 7335]
MAANLPVDELLLEPLHEGDRGPAVAQLQARLAELNAYSSQITGLFDVTTKRALTDFQADYGITEEAGFFGPQTWYALTFWSHETELPTSLFAIGLPLKSWLLQLFAAAAVQPEPLLSSVGNRPEIAPGKILFWPFTNPFAQKVPFS